MIKTRKSLGNVLGQDTTEPGLVLVKPRKDMNKVSCRRDMTEIQLKAVWYIDKNDEYSKEIGYLKNSNDDPKKFRYIQSNLS